MKAADDYQQISNSLYVWQAYEPSVKADLCSSAVVLQSGLVFLDPIPLEKAALCQLAEIAKPSAIVLTNGNHERAASSFKKQFGIPIYAHVDAKGELSADHWIADESELFDSLRAIPLPGFGPGEIALHFSEGEGSVLMGDAIINFSNYEFTLLPDKYCLDPKRGRESLRKLLPLDFERMTFAHGTPIVQGAKARLVNLLSR